MLIVHGGEFDGGGGIRGNHCRCRLFLVCCIGIVHVHVDAVLIRLHTIGRGNHDDHIYRSISITCTSASAIVDSINVCNGRVISLQRRRLLLVLRYCNYFTCRSQTSDHVFHPGTTAIILLLLNPQCDGPIGEGADHHTGILVGVGVGSFVPTSSSRTKQGECRDGTDPICARHRPCPERGSDSVYDATIIINRFIIQGDVDGCCNVEDAIGSVENGLTRKVED